MEYFNIYILCLILFWVYVYAIHDMSKVLQAFEYDLVSDNHKILSLIFNTIGLFGLLWVTFVLFIKYLFKPFKKLFS